jgi:hypothetical protein
MATVAPDLGKIRTEPRGRGERRNREGDEVFQLLMELGVVVVRLAMAVLSVEILIHSPRYINV